MIDPISQSNQLVLGEFLTRWSRRTPNVKALIFEDTSLTYGQLDERVNRLANALTRLGVLNGDRVGFMFQNCIVYAECAFALAKLGAIGVPINFRYQPRELTYVLSQSGAKALIFASEFVDVVTAAKIGLMELKHCICVGKASPDWINYEDLITDSPCESPQVIVNDDDPASILYTSGTTGPAKGAVITHKNLAVTCFSYLPYGVGHEIESRCLIVLPLFHMSGYVALLSSIMGGGTAVISARTTPEEIMATINHEKIKQVTLVPALWDWIVNHSDFNKYDLSSLEIGGTGGAIMSVALKNQIVTQLPGLQLMEGFGMTETPAGTFARHKDIFERHGTVGKPVFIIDLRILDDKGNDVRTGDVGEIVFRGPTVMKEYYKNPDATARAFKDGWYYSGDMGRQDEDGFVYIVDRKKDIIISGGENISAKEVESVILSHPKVQDVAVVGVPDKKWGESVKAFVILHPGQTMTEADIIEYCKDELAGFKKPRFVTFINTFPRTANGKVEKYKLRSV